VQFTGELTDANKLTAKDYRIEYDGSNYVVSSVPNGSVVYQGPGIAPIPPETATSLEFDGVKLEIAGGAPMAGDSWLVQPTRHAAGSLKFVIDDASEIAAAGSATG